MDVGRVLSASVTPVVLISACGLITLALYNRLAMILARLRACHQQQLDLLNAFDADESDDVRSRLELIDDQVGKVTWKAKTVQKGLFCLLSSVVAFLCCSIFAAATVVSELFGIAAVTAHILGLGLFGAGIGWAIRELSQSVSPLEDVSAYLESVVAHRFPAKPRHREERPYRISLRVGRVKRRNRSPSTIRTKPRRSAVRGRMHHYPGLNRHAYLAGPSRTGSGRRNRRVGRAEFDRPLRATQPARPTPSIRPR